MKNKIINKIAEALQNMFDKSQERDNQYVVAYYKVSDNSLIGYHASSFCQLTQDILEGKRYSGENPYPQLQVIAKNASYTLDSQFKGDEMFYDLHMSIRDDFGNLKASEIYMDAIYLAEGTPKQQFRMTLINP